MCVTLSLPPTPSLARKLLRLNISLKLSPAPVLERQTDLLEQFNSNDTLKHRHNSYDNINLISF